MIILKSPEEIKIISESGRILSGILKKIIQEAKEGASLKYLDEVAYRLTKDAGAEPAFLGYRPDGASRPYRASICASLNNIVVHGFPIDYKLKEGDVLSIDFGVKYKGFYSDAAITLGIGKISKDAQKLIEATKKALEEAIKVAKPGYHLGDIGYAVENVAKKYKLKVIKNLTGHGIGHKLHEEPTIFNFGKKGQGAELKEGMVLAIEPMLSMGTNHIIQKNDESWATADGSLAAHFEHTIVIEKNGARVLTR